MINISKLTVNLGGQRILNQVSCTFESGQVTCLLGKSGAGKTTLLKSLVNLVPVLEGSMTLEKVDLKTIPLRKKSESIGYVFQDFNLFNNLTVLANCIDPLLIRGIDKEKAKARALEELSNLGIDSYGDKYPGQL